MAWAHPVVANGKLYIRDQGLLLCYEFPQINRLASVASFRKILSVKEAAGWAMIVKHSINGMLYNNVSYEQAIGVRTPTRLLVLRYRALFE